MEVRGPHNIAEFNGSFSKKVPGLQTFWDSTSLSAFKRCPRFYQYSLIEGWAPRQESVHLSFGSWYHAAIEAYDHARAEGLTHTDGIRRAVRYCLESTWDKERKRPWASDDKNKNRESLVRSVVWYLDQFSGEKDPFKTVILSNGQPAVELSFKYQTDIMLGDEYVTLCGHLDRVAELDGEIYILDKKTTKSALSPEFFDNFTPDNQMSGYTFAGKVVYNLPIKGIVIDAAQILVTFSRFMRGTVYRSEPQLEEWYQNTRVVLQTAYAYAKLGFWPMNEASCGNYGGCQFRELCSKAPSVRAKWKQALMTQRNWDPTVPRGNHG
jgi:hypothetical protein